MKNKETVSRKAEDKKNGCLRVAAYCRASAHPQEQQDSIDAQVKTYTEVIRDRKGWTLAGIYVERADPNIRYKRPQFYQMLKDCDKGLIDCILCRSVAIFARVDHKEMKLLHRLQELGIQTVFDRECLDSESSDYELLLSVLDSFAEEKSRSLSEIDRHGKRKLAQQGIPRYMPLYGYRKAGDNYEIDPDEAKVVRFIFDKYEHGASGDEIAEILTEKGTPASISHRWYGSTIRTMINNEKYVGDYQTQKGYHKDFGDKRRKRYINNGELPSVYLSDHHPAIIPREQFERCNVILNLRKTSAPLQYPFGEYLRCPYCGHVLRVRREDRGYKLCCEGEGACREFVVMELPVEKEILSAYKNINLKAVQKKAGLTDYKIAIEAEKLLRTKERYPAFERIDFWWLDDLVEKIIFGQHTYTASELEEMKETAPDVDDRTISIHWRCGVISTVSSGVKEDYQDPRRRAKLWDERILRKPDKYPRLAEEIQKKNMATDPGSL